MNKTIRLGLIFLISLVFMLSGCAEELTVAEVLQKSANVMSKGGYTYDDKNHLSFVFTMKGGIEKIISGDAHVHLEETGQPPAMHRKGNSKYDDLNSTVESYFVGNESYIQVGKAGWTKIQGVEMRPGGKIERVSDGLAMMAKLFQLGSPTNGVTIKKEANTYVLEFNLQALKANKSFESYIKKNIQLYLDLVQDKVPNGAKLNKEQIQIDVFKDTLRIDAGTFRFLGEERDLKASVPTSDGTVMKVEIDDEVNLKGDFNGKIEVPAYVKSQAEKE